MKEWLLKPLLFVAVLIALAAGGVSLYCAKIQPTNAVGAAPLVKSAHNAELQQAMRDFEQTGR